MEQGATDEDRKRPVAAFRMIDADLVLKLSGDAPPRRLTRRLDTAPGSGSSLSSVCEDSGAGAEVSQPGAGGVEARGHHQGVDGAAITEVVAAPPQGGGFWPPLWARSARRCLARLRALPGAVAKP